MRVIATLAVIVSAALLNVATSLLFSRGTGELAFLVPLVEVILASTVATTGLYVGLWSLLAVPLRKALGLRTRPLRYATAACVLAISLSAPFGYEFIRLLPRGETVDVPSTVAAALGTLFVTWLAYRFAGAEAPPSRWRRIPGLLPAFALTLLAGAWIHAFPDERPRGFAPMRPSPGPSSDAPVGSGMSPRPDLLLISIDTLRADAVDLTDPRGRTPRIAELASQGVVFERARSPAPWTKPAVASLLTGLSPRVHRLTGQYQVLPESIKTLAEYLREAGYATAAFGRNAMLGQTFGYDQGFEVYRFHQRSVGRSFGGVALNWISKARSSTTGLTNLAIEWIEARRRRPTCLWLHYLDPHGPYTPPAPYLTAEKEAADGSSSFATDTGARRRYAAEIRYVDANIGRLLDALRRRGRYGDTLIVLVSDHGEEFSKPDRVGHGRTLTDAVLDVPWIMKLPGSSAHRVVHEPVSTESLTPTLLELLGIEVPARAFSSPSLAGLIGPEARGRGPAPIFSTGLTGVPDRISVLLGSFEYQRELSSGREELFDRSLPSDMRLPIADPHPERLLRFRRLADRFEAEAARSRRRLDLEAPIVVQPDSRLVEELRALGYAE